MDALSLAIGFVVASAILIWRPAWAIVISAAMRAVVAWAVEKWNDRPVNPKE